jgi:uncharacterized protein (DUF697 family)
MTPTEQRAILSLSLLAAFADEAKDALEHAAIRRTAEGFQMTAVDLAEAYQSVLTKQTTLESAVAELTSPDAKTLAYEIALCVCEASGPSVPAELAFLKTLHAALQPAEAAPESPVDVTPLVVAEADLESLLLKYSVLAAALELLPQTAGSLAIIPTQMKLVYDVGQRHGIALDRKSLRDFAAALGIGAVSQVIETGMRRILSGVLGGLGGGTGETVGNVTGGIAGTALTFATTYALGTVADRYYASGRQIDLPMLKEEFTKLVEKAKVMQSQYGTEISSKAKELSEKFKGMEISKILSGLLQGKV